MRFEGTFWQHWLVKGLLITAGSLLLISLFFPYWRVDLEAGIYPKGLALQVHPSHIDGDIKEIDELNHYIGMRKLQTAGQLERVIAIPAIVLAGLCLLIAPFVPRKWSFWLTLPGLVFPVIFLGELYWWLRDSGMNLDPNAPLNQTIKPFIPPLFGDGQIAQFNAKASFQLGFFLALIAAALSRVALYLRKPEWLAKSLIVDAALLLMVSLLFPYWRVDFEAKKFPKPMILQVRPHRLEGNLRQINKINQDLGMQELETVAEFEQKVAVPAVALATLCLLISPVVRKKWAPWLALPSLIFPIVFVAELYRWLRNIGLNLDPEMALYPDTKPFVPPLIGTEKIGSLTTTATFQIGLYFAIAAACVVGFSLYLQHGKRLNLQKHGFVISLSTLMFIITTSPLLAATRIVQPDASIEETLKAAKSGDTVIVKGGYHQERFVIDKRLVLIGEDNPVIDGSGLGSVITVSAPEVTIRGFTIQNTGIRLSEGDAGIMVKKAERARIEENRFEDVLFGVQVRNSPNTVVQNNTFNGKALDIGRRGDLIRVWYSNGAIVENNHVFDGRDVVIWYSKDVTVKHNEVRNGRYGIHFMYCDDAIITENRVIGNSVGIYLMYSYRLQLMKNWIVGNRGTSGYGIGLKDMLNGEIRDNFVADNRAGIFMDNAVNAFSGNLIAYNDSGLSVLPSARRNRFEKNSFVDNGAQVTIEGQGSVQTNQWTGNYWSDYSGYDANHDGIGDAPYRSVHLFEKLTQQYPVLRLFIYSPSASALDFATRLFPIFTPKPKLTDEKPRMRSQAPMLDVPQKQVSILGLLGSMLLCLPGLAFAGFDKWHQRFINSVLPGISTLNSKSDARPRQAAPTISVRHLTKHYGRVTAVEDMSFDVSAGETLALWGENGAGKTTVLRCILGILRFGGTVTLSNTEENGTDSLKRHSSGTAGKVLRRQIGYVPQEVRIHSDLTVKETISFYARLRSVSQAEMEWLIGEWQLVEMLNKKISDLSGGMKQRVALAIALLSDPPILLLDEPTSNLDSETRQEFWTALEHLRASGKTLIFCSHRVDEIIGMADRVIVMKNGKKIAEGPPMSLNNYLSKDVLLYLTIPEAFHGQAATLLEEHGLRVRCRGPNFLVRIAHNEKIEPLQVLMDASIPIHDFELSDSRKGNDT